MLARLEEPEVIDGEASNRGVLNGEDIADGIGNEHVGAALHHGGMNGGEIGEHGGRHPDHIRAVEVLNEIVAKPRREYERVITIATIEGVVAATADQSVIAVTALQQVVAAAAFKKVIAVAAL